MQTVCQHHVDLTWSQPPSSCCRWSRAGSLWSSWRGSADSTPWLRCSRSTLPSPSHKEWPKWRFFFKFYRYILYIIFFVSGVGFPPCPDISTLLHNDPASHQDHCRRCRIRTRGHCPRRLVSYQWAHLIMKQHIIHFFSAIFYGFSLEKTCWMMSEVASLYQQLMLFLFAVRYLYKSWYSVTTNKTHNCSYFYLFSIVSPYNCTDLDRDVTNSANGCEF